MSKDITPSCPRSGTVPDCPVQGHVPSKYQHCRGVSQMLILFGDTFVLQHSTTDQLEMTLARHSRTQLDTSDDITSVQIVKLLLPILNDGLSFRTE